MRAKLIVIVGCIIAVSAPLVVAEDLPNRFAVAALVQKDGAGVYKLEWQRRLLAIQHAFAAELINDVGIDYSATGSITPTNPTPLQH
ncbi:MAG: hypothetical protein KIT02_16140 [Devosia sp.]|uniref:hypothetical protein n=1 Tax=Devosia sp. TaxID=1871048 RepID=UPI0024CB83DC|nr:hypothetical protein [Devosia sp.]UYN99418.1 MAG: hypothetical protein KIT02_16140 [Devosia sp.]